MQRLWAFVALALFLLAGCSRPQANPYEPELAKNEAAARVVVQDNHGQRVANATILVMPAGANGATDELGIFMATGLKPGSQTATVNADGHSDARRTFLARAGEVVEVVLLVDRLR